MKVLLLGEFSGFYKYLSEGLRENGHNVTWYAGGDGFKNITDMDGDIEGRTGNKFYDKIVYPYRLVSGLKGYDVVQLVNPMVFSPWINARLIKMLKKNNKLVVISAVGTDYSVYQYQHRTKRAHEYYLLDECDDYEVYYAKRTRYIKDYEKVMNYCDAIIPGSCEYALAYEGNSKVLPIIRYPINLQQISYQKNIVVNDKVVIFHGLSRENFKGTRHIRVAMEKLKEKYPDEVEIIIDGHMPFEVYMDVMRRANVVIDQCKSYGQGFNALIALAQGKIVLGGAEKEAVMDDMTEECPVWNITPDAEQIFSVLEHIVLNRECISDWGEKSRQYIEKYFDYTDNAKAYEVAWKSLLQRKG